MLVEYIRKGGEKKLNKFNGKTKKSKNRGGKRIGVLVGWKSHNGVIKAGYSLCHKMDKFDANEGLVHAKKRSFAVANLAGKGYIEPVGIRCRENLVPKSIKRKFEYFVERLVNCYGD